MSAGDESETEHEAQSAQREALPAGHPLSWAVLVENTSLAGSAWPGWTAQAADLRLEVA